MLDLDAPRVRTLARAGLVQPKRTATREYRFGFVDLVLLRTVRDLLQAGVPFRRIRSALERLDAELLPGHALTELRLGAVGNRVVVQEDDAIWDAETGQALLDFRAWEIADAIAPVLAAGRRPAPEQEPALDANDWYELGCELEVTSAEEACAAYRRAVATDPGHVDAQVNLGRLLHEAGDLAAAEQHYRRALELRPTDLTARFNLGVALEDMGRLREARNAYRETILAEPDHADAHFNLAGVLEQLGERHQALKHLKTYRSLVHELDFDSDGQR